MQLTDRHIASIISLRQRYKANKLFVFGAVMSERLNEDSDIDLVVDFKKDEVEDYSDFKYSLQDLFGRKVDPAEERSIKNPYFPLTQIG